MSYSKYPYAIDGLTELPISTDNKTPVKAEVTNRLRDSIVKVENELGVKPSGIYSTVRERLDVLTVSVGDLTKYIKRDGTRTFTGNQSMGGHKLTNLAPATNDRDALSFGQSGANLADLTVDTGRFIFTGTDIDLDPSGSFNLSMDNGQIVTLNISDNLLNSLSILAGPSYLNITTINGFEVFTFGNVVTNPDYEFLGSGTITQFGSGQVTFNGNIDALNGLDVSGAELTFTGTNIDLDPTGSFNLNMTGGSTITISLANALDPAFSIYEGINNYIEINTGTEIINFGNIVTNPNFIFLGSGTFTQSGAGQVEFNGNVDAKLGLDVSGADLVMTGTNIDLDPTGSFDLDMVGGTTVTVSLANGLNEAFLIQQGTDFYLEIDTSGEEVNFGNAVTNPNYSFLGTGTFTQSGVGQVTFNGNVNATNGLDVSVAELTMTGTNIDFDPTGTFDLNMGLGSTITISLANTLNNAFLIQQGADYYLEIDTSGEEVNFGNINTDPNFAFLGDGLFTQSGIGQVTFNGNVNATNGLDVSVAALTMTGTNIDFDPQGTFDLDMSLGTTITISLANALNEAFLIKQGGDYYFEIDTSGEEVNFGNPVTNPNYTFLGSGTFTQSGAGQVTFNGNVNATNGLDVSVAELTFTGTNINLDPLGLFTLDMTGVNTVTIKIADGTDSSFLIKEGVANNYLEIDTQNATEIMNFGNTTTDPDFDFLGDGTFTQSGVGQVTFNGNVDAAGGLDITGGSFIFSGTDIDLNPTGNFTLDMTGGTAIITVDDNLNEAFLIKEGVSNYYFEIDTTNAAEIMNFGYALGSINFNFLGGGTFIQSGSGQVSFAGNVDATNGLDVSGSELVMTGTNIDLDPTGTFDLSMDGGQVVTISIADNLDASFLIKEGINYYFEIDTRDNPLPVEIMNFGNTNTNPDYDFIGSGTFTQSGAGQVTFNGNVDAKLGLDVAAGYALTMQGTNIDLDPTGTFDLDMTLGTTVKIVLQNTLAQAFLITEGVGTNYYFEIDTSGEEISFGNANTNPDFTFYGTGDFTQATGQVTFNGNVNAKNGLDVSGAALTMTGTNITFEPTGTFILDMDAGQIVTITIANDLNESFLIKEGAGNNYLEIDTTDGPANESMTFGNASTNPDFVFLGSGLFTQSGAGQVEFNGNVDATNGLDVSVGELTMTGTNIDLDPAGTFDLTMTGSNTVTISIANNTNAALLIQEGANSYLEIDTTDAPASVEIMIFGNATTDPDFTFLGSGTFTQSGVGQVEFNGNVDATNGLDVSVGELTFTGTNISLTPAGTFSLDMTGGSTITIVTVDDDPVAFNINEGGNDYVNIDTTDGLEVMSFGNAVTNPDFIFLGTGAITQSGTGQVTFNGNIRANLGLDVSGADLEMTGTNISLTPSGTFALDMTGGSTITITIVDDEVSSFNVNEGGNHYFDIDTTDGSEMITFGWGFTNPDYTFAGSGTFTQSGAGQVEFNGNVNANLGLDVIAGAFTVGAAATNIDLDPTGNFTLDMDAGQAITITVAHIDNAFVITDGADYFFEIDTWNEEINFGNAVTNPNYAFLGSGTLMQSGAGQVTFNGNVDAAGGLDISVAPLTFTGTSIDLDPTGTFALDMDANQTVTITISDTLDSSFLIKEGAGNNYLEIDTRTGVEIMNFGNTTTNPDYTFAGNGLFTQSGAGQVEFNGNIDAKAGLDITAGFAFTMQGTNIDLDPTGTFTLDMDDNQTITISVDDDCDNAFLIKDINSKNYIEIDTRTAGNGPIINFGNTDTNPDYEFIGSGTFTQSGAGQVTFNGNVDAVNGLDISIAALTMTGTNIDLDPTGTFDLAMDANQTVTITISDNLDAAFLIKEAGTNYFEIDTSAEKMNFGMNIANHPDFEFLGDGTFTKSGTGAMSLTGAITIVTSLNCKLNSAPFYPRRVRQSGIPAPASGELLMWSDSDDDKVYLVYNDPTAGTKSVELT